MESSNKRICSSCGRVLEDDHIFCPKCGCKLNEVSPIDNSSNDTNQKGNDNGEELLNESTNKESNITEKGNDEVLNETNKCDNSTNENSNIEDNYKENSNNEDNDNTKPKNYVKHIVIAVIVLFILSLIFKNFNIYFGAYKNKEWCEIAANGSYMKIDTNPRDINDYNIAEAYYEIEEINAKLFFSPALFKKIERTSALSGIQTDSNLLFKVSWRYSPSSGLEIIYEWK